MDRLTKEDIPTKAKHPITSVNLSPELLEKLEEEMIRLGVRSRSEMIRLICDHYFKSE